MSRNWSSWHFQRKTQTWHLSLTYGVQGCFCLIVFIFLVLTHSGKECSSPKVCAPPPVGAGLKAHFWRRQWHPTPVLLPGKSHGRRSLVGCSPWGHEESDTTEWLHFHFSLSRTGEGNGNPLQCSCLENPRDGGARWAAVYGVAQSWTRLKWLSSSRNSKAYFEAPLSNNSTPKTVWRLVY